MDYSLNLINLEKKIRFYCEDKVHIIEKVPDDMKKKLWYTEVDENKAVLEVNKLIKKISSYYKISKRDAIKRMELELV